MYDMFADECNECSYITFDRFISEIQKYCTKEEFNKVIDESEEHSYNKYLYAKELLKGKIEGKSFSL